MAEGATHHDAALSLLRYVAWAEGKNLNISHGNADAPTREWILHTYAQCLEIAIHPQQVDTIAKWEIPKK